MVSNVSPKQSFEALLADPDAQLVDVRTDAEWQYVGLPDLRRVGKQAVLVSWQYFPSGRVNPDFVGELRESGLVESQKLYFICRSGVRSLAAAEAAEAAGFGACFNVAHGFEGAPDGEGHRGTVAGWKADGLPWRQ
jgi:rhodanese-related sulfurtransferase